MCAYIYVGIYIDVYAGIWFCYIHIYIYYVRSHFGSTVTMRNRQDQGRRRRLRRQKPPPAPEKRPPPPCHPPPPHLSKQMSLLPVKTQQVPIGAERPVVRSSKRCSLDDHDTRVEDFIGENELDERAAAALRGASLDLSEAVMMRGSLRGTRNKSSALLGRLRDAAAILTLNVAGEEAAKKRPRPPPPVSMVPAPPQPPLQHS